MVSEPDGQDVIEAQPEDFVVVPHDTVHREGRGRLKSAPAPGSRADGHAARESRIAGRGVSARDRCSWPSATDAIRAGCNRAVGERSRW